MIGQYLSNKNESATVAKNLKFCQLNKASVCFACIAAAAAGFCSVLLLLHTHTHTLYTIFFLKKHRTGSLLHILFSSCLPPPTSLESRASAFCVPHKHASHSPCFLLPQGYPQTIVKPIAFFSHLPLPCQPCEEGLLYISTTRVLQSLLPSSIPPPSCIAGLSSLPQFPIPLAPSRPQLA